MEDLIATFPRLAEPGSMGGELVWLIDMIDYSSLIPSAAVGIEAGAEVAMQEPDRPHQCFAVG
jgi:hypothetical protein